MTNNPTEESSQRFLLKKTCTRALRFEFPEHINIENPKESNIKKTDKEKKNNKAINEV